MVESMSHFGLKPLGEFSPRMSLFLSFCYRNPLELCGWHFVRCQVSVCDAGGYPQPPVLLYQHDHSLPGAWHHIHVSYSLLWTHNKTDPVTRAQSKSGLTKAFVLSICCSMYSYLSAALFCASSNCPSVLIKNVYIVELLCSLWQHEKNKF